MNNESIRYCCINQKQKLSVRLRARKGELVFQAKYKSTN